MNPSDKTNVSDGDALVEFEFERDWINRRTEYKAGQKAMLHKQDAFKIENAKGGRIVTGSAPAARTDSDGSASGPDANNTGTASRGASKR
jgi:hypothetical protein